MASWTMVLLENVLGKAVCKGDCLVFKCKSWKIHEEFLHTLPLAEKVTSTSGLIQKTEFPLSKDLGAGHTARVCEEKNTTKRKTRNHIFVVGWMFLSEDEVLRRKGLQRGNEGFPKNYVYKRSKSYNIIHYGHAE